MTTGYREVALPSGAMLPVLTDEEVDYLTEKVVEYENEFKLTNISDRATLDLVITFELLTHRWGIWLSKGYDYQSEAVDEASLRSDLLKYSLELRQQKKILGIDKLTRDRAKGEGSVPAFIASLTERAKAFGIMREKQLDRALELLQELLGMVTFHKNADEEERREFRVTSEDLIEWIDTIARVEFDAVDAHFREHEQRLWIRKQ